MTLPELQYRRPRSLEEALQALDEKGRDALVLAGGTDLVVVMSKGGLSASTLVDIQNLKELRQITIQEGELFVGARATFTQIAGDGLVRTWAPALSEAASLVGSPQIRNTGTIGGNLGTASPAGDTLAPLVAHAAIVHVLSVTGARSLPLARFLGEDPAERLQPNELIRGVSMPLGLEGSFDSIFVRLGRRNALAISRINAALFLRYEGEAVAAARLVLGAVGPGPIRVRPAERALEQGGSTATASLLMQHAAEAVAESCGTRPTVPYKTRAVQGLILEALRRCRCWDRLGQQRQESGGIDE